MSGDIIRLPPRSRRPNPDALAVAYDLGVWTIAFFQSGRFRNRRIFGSEAEARAEAERLIRDRGLRWFSTEDGR